jgi:hypothetical protein
MGERCVLILIILACAWAFVYSVTHPSRRPGRLPRDIAFDVILGAGLLGFGTVAWKSWTSIITLDENAVSWKVGSQVRSLRWDEIDGLSCSGVDRAVRWGLVEKGSGICYRLPLMSRELFVALKERTRVLPPDL